MISEADARCRIAVFDLDGTLTVHDTMWLFFRHVSASKIDFCLKIIRLLPALAAYSVGKVSAGDCKLKLCDVFLGGMPGSEVERLAESFGKKIDSDLRPFAREYISMLREGGYSIWLCTASANIWVGEWACKFGFDKVLCTEFGLDERGKYVALSPNCKGEQKRIRIEESLPAERNFCFIKAFGNSDDDEAMLRYADESHYKPNFSRLFSLSDTE